MIAFESLDKIVFAPKSIVKKSEALNKGGVVQGY